MKDLLIQLECFKAFELKAYFDTRTELIKLLENKFNFGSKTFNTHFEYPKDEPGSYKRPDLLKPYRRDKQALEKVLKEEKLTNLNQETLKRFVHFLDIYLAFNHKLSGCREFIKKLNEIIKMYKENKPEEFNRPENKEALREELQRINKEIVEREKKWKAPMRDLLSRISYFTLLVNKMPQIPQNIKQSLDKSLEDLVEYYKDYEKKEVSLSREIQEYRSITAFLI